MLIEFTLKSTKRLTVNSFARRRRGTKRRFVAAVNVNIIRNASGIVLFMVSAIFRMPIFRCTAVELRNWVMRKKYRVF